MIIRRVSLMDTFRCLAGDCPDSCCRGWKIAIDDAALNRYAALEGAFGETVRKAVDWHEGCFKIKEGHCALLTDQGLCRLILTLGEEALCESCRLYPRHTEEYPGFIEQSLSMSCPQAARAYLGAEELTFISEEKTEPETDWEEEEREIAERLLPGLFSLRALILDLLKDWPVDARMISLLKGLAFACQAALEDGEEIGKAQRAYLSKELPALSRERRSGPLSGQMGRLSRERDLLLSLQEVEPSFREKILLACPCKEEPKGLQGGGEILLSPGREGERKLLLTAQKNLIAYYTDVYLPGAIFDGDLYSKICLGILASDWLGTYCESLLLKGGSLTLEKISSFASSFAAQIEHSDENLLRVFDFLAGEA